MAGLLLIFINLILTFRDTLQSPESLADTTRNLPQQNLTTLAKVLHGVIGGSADLASSNMTLLKMFGYFQKDTPGAMLDLELQTLFQTIH